MEVNGWRLYEHPLFQFKYDKLWAELEKLQETQPETYHNQTSVKLLKRITDLVSEEIPADPSHDRFNLGKTLGTDFRHWKRAKFGRYRLFFRYEQKTKVIIYAWINDDKTLRKEGDKNDPYALFAKGLARGQPPDSIAQLLKESRELDLKLEARTNQVN